MQNEHTGEVSVVPIQTRRTANTIINGRPSIAYLFCTKGLREIPVNEQRHGVEVKDAINQEHDCAEFMARLGEKSPREHEEMTLLEKLEARDRSREEARSREDTRRRNEDVDWRRNTEARATKRFWIGFGVTACLAVLTSVVIELAKRYIAGQ